MGNMGQEGGRGVETDSEVLHKAVTTEIPGNMRGTGRPDAGYLT